MENCSFRALNFRIRKAKGAVPHDLGVPDEDPFKQINQFSWQDTNGWKDLNPKFVLMVYRDFVFTGRKDQEFLRTTWPAVEESLAYLQKYDHDGSGIPQNEGYPDQTYDEWVVRGESAYSGGLWLAALRSAEEIAKQLGDSAGSSSTTTFCQGAGQLHQKALEQGVFSLRYRQRIPRQHSSRPARRPVVRQHDRPWRSCSARNAAQRAAQNFDFNVMKFADGSMGAVNGIAPDGSLVKTNEQVQEVWTGTTFGLAALMLSEGMKNEAYKTAWGIYHTSYEPKVTGSVLRKPGILPETTARQCICAPQPSGPWR